MSPDTHEEANGLREKLKELYGATPDFPFLQDVEHRVIDRYGLYNPAGGVRGIPHPAVFIIDRRGIVRWRFVETNYKLRPTNERILEALAGLVPPGRKTLLPTATAPGRQIGKNGPRISARPDRKEMALVPAGQFAMGDSRGGEDSQPAHPVWLPAFLMDQYEVTYAQYREFLATKTGSRDHFPFFWDDPQWSGDSLPVVGVDWDDASAYCAWAGKRLPTEAEWEKAARGGLEGKLYPWGDSLDPALANFNHEGDWKSRHPTPVGTYPPNGYGLYDMAGNVWEWTADWYKPDYYREGPHENPTGPTTGTMRVARGGSWSYSGFMMGRVAYRAPFYPEKRAPFLGFRCARSP